MRTFVISMGVIVFAAAAFATFVPGSTTHGAGPARTFVQTQTDAPLDAAPTAATNGLLVIAHNAGDSPTTIASSLAHHARVIEIDTTLEGSVLRARHDAGSRSASDVVDHSQTASAAWHTANTPGILLDLKTSGPATTRLVALLIAEHPSTRVLVSTPNVPTLALVAAAAPGTLRLLSIGTPPQLQAVLRAPSTTAYQGVSIANALVTQTTARQLEAHHLWIQAWTVDSMQRVDQLASWGVNGITTNSLTIMNALSRSTV